MSDKNKIDLLPVKNYLEDILNRRSYQNLEVGDLDYIISEIQNVINEVEEQNGNKKETIGLRIELKKLQKVTDEKRPVTEIIETGSVTELKRKSKTTDFGKAA